jgi:nitrate/nitrite-specific signal transduction histidine kinase
MTRSVTKPLKEMALASGEYAAGHFEKRIHENRISEIDTLGQSLNKMAEDLAGLEQMRMGLSPMFPMNFVRQ